MKTMCVLKSAQYQTCLISSANMSTILEQSTFQMLLSLISLPTCHNTAQPLLVKTWEIEIPEEMDLLFTGEHVSLFTTFITS